MAELSAQIHLPADSSLQRQGQHAGNQRKHAGAAADHMVKLLLAESGRVVVC